MKQIKYKDLENNTIHGGILLDDGDIICACCGGLIEKDDPDIQILDKYNEWIDFSTTIID